MSEPLSLKAKVILILFGAALGVLTLQIALQLYFAVPQGSEFQNLTELRRAILAEGSAAGEKNGAVVRSGGDAVDEGSQRRTLRGVIVPHPSDDIIYDLIPGLKTGFVRSQVAINSCGMRDQERPIAKPPGTFRIALLGDSFAFGWGVEQEQTFAARLETKLNTRASPDRRFEVLNFGVPGYSTFQEVARFEESGLDFDPDVVLVFFVDNDFGMPFFIRDIYNPGSILDALTFARRSWRGTDSKIEEQRLQLARYDANRALIKLTELGGQHGFQIFLAVNPRKNSSEIKRQLWVLKNHPEITYLELRKSFLEVIARRKISDAALTLSFDPHPSPLRHELYADLTNCMPIC